MGQPYSVVVVIFHACSSLFTQEQGRDDKHDALASNNPKGYSQLPGSPSPGRNIHIPARHSSLYQLPSSLASRRCGRG